MHYYISGDFSVGIDESVPSTEDDAEDEAEQGAESILDDSKAGDEDAIPDDEGPEDMEFEKEALQVCACVRVCICLLSLLCARAHFFSVCVYFWGRNLLRSLLESPDNAENMHANAPS